MTRLPIKHRLIDGQIACRSLRTLAAGERLVVTIPGGPGLGGRYLEPFLAKLAQATSMNVALIDLPNHGASSLGDGRRLDYLGCLKMLDAAIVELGRNCGDIILFGQSYGARLAFDLLAVSEARIRRAILAGVPVEFENSTALKEKLAKVALEPFTDSARDEHIFARNWRKLLPFYTRDPLPAPIFAELAAGTKWVGNEQMLDRVPAMKGMADRLKKRSAVPPVLILQGSDDLVVPDGNLQALRELLPEAEVHEVPRSGHFVMVENPEETLSLIEEFVRPARASHA